MFHEFQMVYQSPSLSGIRAMSLDKFNSVGFGPKFYEGFVLFCYWRSYRASIPQDQCFHLEEWFNNSFEVIVALKACSQICSTI